MSNPRPQEHHNLHEYRGNGSESPLRNVENVDRDNPGPEVRFTYEPLDEDTPYKVPDVRSTRSRASRGTIALSILNIIIPLAICALYIVIVFGYLLRSAINGVVPHHRVDPRSMFFLWLISSIFLLEWAKTALAWVEAAVMLNHPKLAPANALQLSWHFERGWASLATWWAIICHGYGYLRSRHSGFYQQNKWHGPGRLWWVLALVYLLFGITVPLAGLSMEPEEASRISNERVTVLGVNETTFDVRTNVAVSGQARDNWRTGSVTTPEEPAVFYAPERTENVSATYFEDAARNIYQQDSATPGNQTDIRYIDFFSGPTVATRAHGRAWGLRNVVACSAVSLEDRGTTGLQLINSTSPTEWQGITYPGSSETWDETYSGTTPIFAYNYLNAFGSNFTYVVASDRSLESTGTGEYVSIPEYNLTARTIEGSLEIILWQSIAAGYQPDETFRNMSSHPLVTSADNGTYLGYGIRCEVISDVGFATMDAVRHTFSEFERFDAVWGSVSVGDVSEAGVPLFQWPGVFAIQSLAFQALTTVSLGYLGPPACSNYSTDSTCNMVYSANGATGAVPRVATVGSNGLGRALQIPTLSPERMTLAMYKLFGETAAAMTAIGSGNWTRNDFYALEPANDLVPGRVDWRLVLVLLCVWTALIVTLQLLTLTESRMGESLEALAVRRYGAHWREELRKE